MVSNKIFWIIWLLFITYSIFLAPRNQPSTRSTSLYVKELMFGPWNDIDPYVITLFYFLGIWPLIYMSVLLVDGQNQRINGMLASCLAMALGGFILLPYLALRRSEKAKMFQINRFVRIFESKLIPLLLLASTVGLILFAVRLGNFNAFIHEFSTNLFIHIMTIDFCVVSLSFPCLLHDDFQRRNMTDQSKNQQYVYLSFVPLIGPLVYLYCRQPLKHTSDKNLHD